MSTSDVPRQTAIGQPGQCVAPAKDPRHTSRKPNVIKRFFSYINKVLDDVLNFG